MKAILSSFNDLHKIDDDNPDFARVRFDEVVAYLKADPANAVQIKTKVGMAAIWFNFFREKGYLMSSTPFEETEIKFADTAEEALICALADAKGRVSE